MECWYYAGTLYTQYSVYSHTTGQKAEPACQLSYEKRGEGIGLLFKASPLQARESIEFSFFYLLIQKS